MTDYEAGYLQALKDVQDTVRHMISDRGATSEGKVEMRRVMSFLDGLINTKIRRHGDHDTYDPPGSRF